MTSESSVKYTVGTGENDGNAKIVLPIGQNCQKLVFENVQKRRQRWIIYTVLFVTFAPCFLIALLQFPFASLFHTNSNQVLVGGKNSTLSSSIAEIQEFERPNQINNKTVNKEETEAEKAIRLWKLFSRNDFMFVDNRFKPEDALELLNLHPNNTKIASNANSIIKANFTSFIKTDGFLSLPFESLLQILRWENIVVPSTEEVVFNASVRWLEYKQERRKFAPTVLGTVRMPLLSASFLRTIVWNNQIVKECEQCREMVVDAFAYQANASLAVKSNVWPRIPGNWSTDSTLHGKPYQLSVINFVTHKIRFQMEIRIENFIWFITSKKEYYSSKLTKNNTEWYMYMDLRKYSQSQKQYTYIGEYSSDRAEMFTAFLYGKRNDRKECSLDVDATFSFKQPAIEDVKRVSKKYYFNSGNAYTNWSGFGEFAKIEDLLKAQNGHLFNQPLELLVDVSISES